MYSFGSDDGHDCKKNRYAGSESSHTQDQRRVIRRIRVESYAGSESSHTQGQH